MENAAKSSLFVPITVSLCLSAILVALTGCGNLVSRTADGLYVDGYDRAAATASGSSSGFSNGFTVLQGIPFTCPTTANILPRYDVNFNGTDRFRVCESGQAQEKIAIYGSTQYSSTLCVFPALAKSSGTTLYKNAAGSAYSVCGRMDIAEPVIAFDSSVLFNAVFIVEAPFESAMRTCLTQGNPNICPSQYSYGVFREPPTNATTTTTNTNTNTQAI